MLDTDIYTNEYYIYILSSKKNGVLYVGVTSDLIKRIWEHKNKVIKCFTEKYNVSNLVYFETSNDVNVAIQREKTIKKYNRQWKIDLIEQKNPEWLDLYDDIVGF